MLYCETVFTNAITNEIFLSSDNALKFCAQWGCSRKLGVACATEVTALELMECHLSFIYAFDFELTVGVRANLREGKGSGEWR